MVLLSLTANIMNWFTPKTKNTQTRLLTTAEITKFTMLGTLMFCSKIIMEWIPNVHLLGMFTMVYTLVYRKKALIPIYVYVMLNGVFAGFSPWWIPYLYIWTILWGITMLLPPKIPVKVAAIVYPIICALHGFLFGTMYAPTQAIMFGYDFKTMLAWIGAGFYFDILHAIGNFALGFLIVPLSNTLKKAHKTAGKEN